MWSVIHNGQLLHTCQPHKPNFSEGALGKTMHPLRINLWLNYIYTSKALRYFDSHIKHVSTLYPPDVMHATRSHNHTPFNQNYTP